MISGAELTDLKYSDDCHLDHGFTFPPWASIKIRSTTGTPCKYQSSINLPHLPGYLLCNTRVDLRSKGPNPDSRCAYDLLRLFNLSLIFYQTSSSSMGRYDLRPLRVHQTVTQLLAAEKLKVPPAWYDTVGSIAPSQALVRTQPFQHHERSNQPRAKARKPSRSFQPTQIVYPEDQLRKEFFSDHPWELARPRMVLEVDGKDAERCDWSKMSQTGRALSGER